MNERLKKIRKHLKLSQAEFGERIFVTQNHVSSLESGRRALSDRNIKTICSEFGVNENWLRTGEGEMLIDLVDDLEGIDEESKEILRKFRALSDEDKSKMEKILDTFLNE